MIKLVKKILTLFVIICFLFICLSPTNIGFNYENSEFSAQKILSNDSFFDKYIALLMKIGHIPSLSACIIKNNSLVWSEGYGYYDLENERIATNNTLYLIASLSKSVTATALMQLVENESYNIDLDEDINIFLNFSIRNPNFPDKPITFRMLLAHQSSLSYDEEFEEIWSINPGDPDIPSYPYPMLKEYLTPNGSAYSPKVWSKYYPGEKYLYANIGYSIIGYLVEIVSGQNFNEYCKKHIFYPLEMYNTSFRLRDVDIENLAVPYKYEKGEYIPYCHYNNILIYPAGSVRTSINDFSNFLITHMNKGVFNGIRILNESTVELMQTIQYPSKEKWQSGFGWFIKRNQYGHGGSSFGYTTNMFVMKNHDTGVMYFINMKPSNRIQSISILLIKIALMLKAYSV